MWVPKKTIQVSLYQNACSFGAQYAQRLLFWLKTKSSQNKLFIKIIVLVQILFMEPDYGISSKTRILDEPICKNANKMDIAFLTLNTADWIS